MALLFEPPADPLTRVGAGSYLIESDALQRLTREIERYGRGELAGRSILIAGHRGVGKTTLVRKAIENARGIRSLYQGRPLFVDLHGPDLLAPPDKKATGTAENTAPDEADENDDEDAENDEGGEKKPAPDAAGPSNHTKAKPKKPRAEADTTGNDSSKQPSGADLQSFVERLTFSLYRAAVKEFVASFRELVRDRMNADESRSLEYSELAEQFAFELDGSTDLARIRLLYERVGAFAKGILNTFASVTGPQELALLAASSQAYRIISGKLDENLKQVKSATNTAKWTIAADNLLSPVIGLLTGGLVWAALPASFGPLGKLFTSFATGLASAVVVKFTRTIQRESKLSTNVTFVPQRDRLALRRLLPVLVERFCDVGLPPIFVVDELDKVPNISERMEALMGFLKQFVTERAFFCFLVDRVYYEKLEGTVSKGSFPPEATLFGDRLFVQYTPKSAHSYLNRVTKPGTPAVGESLDDASRDLEALEYVLLRRSYMHPFELRREISRVTNQKNEFRFQPRTLFNVRQYQNEVYYQVAVECVLEKLLDFAEDPNRAQLLYDTLYFPIRTKKQSEEFDTSPEKLEKHLAGRMGSETGKLLNEDRLGILHGALLDLVKFLCEPRSLLDTMEALQPKHPPEPKRFRQAAVGIIEAAAGPKPTATAPPASTQAPRTDGMEIGQSGSAPGTPPVLNEPPTPQPPLIFQPKATPLLKQTAVGKYEWLYDDYGYQLEIEVVEPRTVTGSAVSAEVASLLNDFDNAAGFLSTKRGTALDIELWERMRLVPTPPTWSFLSEAAQALRQPGSIPQSKLQDYSKALIEYRSNLQSALQTIWSAVAIAATIAVHDRREKEERRSLQVLATVLAEASSRDQLLHQLDQIARDTVNVNALQPFAFHPNASYRDMLDAIEASAHAVRTQPPKAASDVALQSANFYDRWFLEFYEGRRPMVDSLWPFLSLVMGSLPLGLRNVNPLRMTISDWTKAKSKGEERQRIMSLERLGFRRKAEEAALASKSFDDLLKAIVQSIRKRGHEQVSVILLPTRRTLTESWLPSENIACCIAMEEADLNIDAKYLLVEIDDEHPDRVTIPTLNPPKRTALFGRGTIPPGVVAHPYITAPMSIDDLVEHLDALPINEWGISRHPEAPNPP